MEKGLGIDRLEQRKARRVLLCRDKKTLLRAYGIEKEETKGGDNRRNYRTSNSPLHALILLFCLFIYM